ncbi:MAG: HEAT repeat domain-containing protein [Desulfobacterales bacterium]|jgi:hypothetical protein
MGRGRKPEERSTVSGIRFKRAIEIFGKKRTTIVYDQRWIEIVDIWDEKTIRTWITHGIPLSKLSNVSQFFGVPGHIFTDEKINQDEFDKIIHESKFHLVNPDADIPVLKGIKEVEQTSFSKLERIKVIDRSTSKDLFNISKKSGMYTPVIDFLMRAMSNPDPAERYWVYITLGLIRSDRAKALVEQGLTDEDEFARSGAERAMDIMNEKPDSKGG